MHRELEIPRRVCFPVLHTAWVLLVMWMIWYPDLPPTNEKYGLWVLVLLPDLPAWGYLYLIDKATGERLWHWPLLFPAIGFLLLGGLQWWTIGWLFDRRKHKAKEDDKL